MESLEHFSNLIRRDTSNPPGNETEAATYLQGVLAQAGITADLFSLDPARANLVARISGNGSKQPILVMGHTDVVGVQRENWTVDPFGAIVKDGYVYGRGTLDDKDNVTALYHDRVAVAVGAEVVAQHPRAFRRGAKVLDARHVLPLLGESRANRVTGPVGRLAH